MSAELERIEKALANPAADGGDVSWRFKSIRLNDRSFESLSDKLTNCCGWRYCEYLLSRCGFSVGNRCYEQIYRRLKRRPLKFWGGKTSIPLLKMFVVATSV